MQTKEDSKIISEIAEELSNFQTVKILCNQHFNNEPLPSIKALNEIVSLCRAVIFPGYFGKSNINQSTLKFHQGINIEHIQHLLEEQIYAGICCDNDEKGREERQAKASKIATEFITYLPELRQLLASDVIAAYNGDPAAESYAEVILCYPAIKAIINHRIAHKLLKLGVPLIPRMISELAHSETGIDIHPAATIDKSFTIDHGTGVVIGATAIIGKNVKIYQGVTLGAKSFPLDDDGNPIKGIPRHPILKDNVIIYSNATILGRITIGEGAVIGGNIWVTEDIEANKIVTQTKAKKDI